MAIFCCEARREVGKQLMVEGLMILEKPATIVDVLIKFYGNGNKVNLKNKDI